MAAIIKEKLYTVESLMQFVKECITTQVKSHANTNATDREYNMNERTQTYLQQCYYGDESDKMFVKQMMRRIMTEGNGSASENFPANYAVTVTNIDRFINWNEPRTVDAYVLFLAILLHYKDDYGSNALGYLIDKYHFNNLRPRGREGLGFYIDDNDVRDMWNEEALRMDFDAKLEVLLQLVYEETYGNSCLDEILYQNVGDISAGVSGIPDDMTITVSEENIPAYRTAWIRYKGCSIHFMFLSFGSMENLHKVAKQMVNYQMKGQFSEKEGFKLGYGKDGSRRTAAIKPFGESPALWVRKFTEQTSTNESLYGGIKNYQTVMAIESALVKGGATIPVCGAQGSGKTTKLETLTQYIQNFYSIRVLESEFEAHLRWKYPMKNIFTMEANDTTPVTPSMAYNFSLRSAGDIYIIGEARSDDMIINVTRTANRGGRSVLFTFHPKTAAMTIPEIANAMIREKMYANLKDAVATALNTVKCCIFVTVDLETHRHFYEIFEFVPRPNNIPDDFMREKDPDKRQLLFMQSIHAYMQTMVSADTFYYTVPLVVYDHESDSYVMKNTVSQGLYDELMEKTPLEVERMDLRRIFRPKEFIEEYARMNNLAPTEELTTRLIQEYALNPKFFDV